jgi:hypothetical protein
MTQQSSDTKDKALAPPAPEVLRPQADTPQSAPEAVHTTTPKKGVGLHHITYRPSHKATFIGLVIVAAIIAINIGVISFVMNSQAKDSASAQGEVTLSPSTLDKLGVSRNAVGNAGTAELVVGPNSRFNGKVVVGGDVSIAGQLKLSSKFSATDASLAKLQAGDTSLNQVNVNGDATATNLNLRKDLTVL